MYTAAIVLHSVLRWVVIVLGVIAVTRALAGRSGGRAWTAADATPGRLYTIALDVQMLIGLLLYFVFSPILSIASADWGQAMGNSAIRYWVVEHLASMVIAIALAHVGTVRVRKAATDAARFTQATIFYGLSLLLVVIASPWPGLPYGRALLRLW
ncbi:MAG: hypothetical protein AB7Q16_16905 [Vicinamibacterales bacterium]